MKIPDNELLKGSELCKENTMLLLEDAELLVKKESCGHAAFFVVTAYEEYCKRILLYNIGMHADLFEEEEKKIIYDKVIRQHFYKSLGSTLLGVAPNINDFIKELNNNMDKLKTICSNWKQIREQGLYVDWDAKEQYWLSPTLLDSEVEKEVIQFIEHLKSTISGFEKVIEKQSNE